MDIYIPSSSQYIIIDNHGSIDETWHYVWIIAVMADPAAWRSRILSGTILDTRRTSST